MKSNLFLPRLCLVLILLILGGATLKAQDAGAVKTVQYCVKYSQGPKDDPIPPNTPPDCDVLICVTFTYCQKDASGSCVPGTQQTVSQCKMLRQNEPYCFIFTIPENTSVDENSVQYSITPANFITTTVSKIDLSDEVITWTPNRCPHSSGILLRLMNDVLYFWCTHDQ